MLVPISEKSHLSGYLTWGQAQEKDINLFLRGLDSVYLFFQNEDRGVKKINRKTRRIHLGETKTIELGIKNYRLVRRGESLIVTLV